MFIKVKDYILNTERITHAVWRKVAEGSPSEARQLIIYFATTATNSSLTLKEDEEVKKLWAFLEEQCQPK
ncbi:MAG TPA: hypothetical protein VFZ34_32585 [Blastocatellia bacterium]|nr:hypothetical protein [Blastocatellia bacterium]